MKNANDDFHSTSSLEVLVKGFEAICNDVISRKQALQEKLFADEHAQKYAGRVDDATPESGVFDLETVEAAAQTLGSDSEWKRRRHAYVKALSRHPAEDAAIAEGLLEALEALSQASETVEMELTSYIIAAQKEAQEASNRLAAAQEARKQFRMSVNGRLLTAFREAARAGDEIGNNRFMLEGLSAPHAKHISALASTRGTIGELCETLAAEINFAKAESAARRNIPERVQYITAPHEQNAGTPSPEELAYIGANDGKGGLRSLFRGWAGK